MIEDPARLRRELRSRDDLYESCFRIGYVGMQLAVSRRDDWELVAAWESGRDWAIKDRLSGDPPAQADRGWVKRFRRAWAAGRLEH